MTEAIQFVVALMALLMLGYGLWIVHPAAMYIGVGSLLLSGIVMSRTLRVRRRSR